MAIVHGTEGSDTINILTGATYYADRIYGYGGVDYLYGNDGDDEIWGGEGDDWLYGHADNDLLKGGGGADRLWGGGGDDWVSYADAPTGIDAFLTAGGRGYGRGGFAEGDTFLDIDNLSGSRFDDDLVGNEEANELAGQAGNDELSGGRGADRLSGGTGFDWANYHNSSAGVFVSLISGLGSGGDAQGDTLTGIENLDGSYEHGDVLVGNDGPNDIAGFGGEDSLKGGGGVDELFGGAEDDMLDGGSDADVMFGDHGNDTYYVDNASDDILEWPGYGSDTVRASVSYVLPSGDAEVELLRTTDDNGIAPINLTGNAIPSQQIIGNNGHNTLDGGGGNDQLIGRRGNDTYIVDGDTDTITERAGEGMDTALARASYTLTAGADVETLATTNDFGTAAINLTGNASGNIVRGNNGSNVINGGGGRDDLTGRGGDDWFRFDTAPSATNVDLIADLNGAGNDTIVLEDLIFGAFATGPLAAERFVTTAPLQDNDNIIYDADGLIYGAGSRALFYDSDGNGPAAAVQFATLTPGTVVSHLDFLVV
jgi:Ca2+-binding RTX toxin-like protein